MQNNSESIINERLNIELKNIYNWLEVKYIKKTITHGEKIRNLNL